MRNFLSQVQEMSAPANIKRRSAAGAALRSKQLQWRAQCPCKYRQEVRQSVHIMGPDGLAGKTERYCRVSAMKQNAARTKHAIAEVPRCELGHRLSGADRREQLLETAAAEFASTGLRGTTTAALAERAGVSEPILYVHFETKDLLFRETVERNVESRLRTLEANLARCADQNLVGSVERMAEATVAVCLSGEANAVLTNWALLETPDYAVDLHRREVGCVCSMWERLLAERFPDSRSRNVISRRLVPYIVQVKLVWRTDFGLPSFGTAQ